MGREQLRTSQVTVYLLSVKSDPDFRTNPDSEPDICRIAPKMLRIYYLVGISHFAECRDCMKDADKCHKIPLFRKGKKS